MNNPFKKLTFNLHHDYPNKSYSVGVILDGQEIYRIQNFFHLSKSLGLLGAPQTLEQLQNFVESDNQVFPSAECFQSKITEYLYENCAQFRETYHQYFASLVGNCTFKGVADNANCKQCYRHPNTISV